MIKIKENLCSTKYFNIIYCNDDLEIGNFIVNNIDNFYIRLCNDFKIEILDNFNFTIIVANSIDDYINYTGKAKSEYKTWMVGHSNLKTRKICILSPEIAKDYSSEELIQVLKHEIVHAVFDNYYGTEENEAWISEGVALLYAGQIDLQYVEEAIPIEKIQGKTINGDTPDNFIENGGYDVAGIYVYWLFNKYGFEMFSKVYKNEIYINELIYPGFENEAITFYKNHISLQNCLK